jgi:hypothetical protein
MRSRALCGIISEAVSCHHFGIIQVAAINDDGIFQFVIELPQIEIGKFFPFNEDRQVVVGGNGPVGGIRAGERQMRDTGKICRGEPP